MNKFKDWLKPNSKIDLRISYDKGTFEVEFAPFSITEDTVHNLAEMLYHINIGNLESLMFDAMSDGVNESQIKTILQMYKNLSNRQNSKSNYILPSQVTGRLLNGASQ